MTASAQIPHSDEDMHPSVGQSDDRATSGGASAAPTTSVVEPQVTVTGKTPSVERPLPTLPQDEFMNCAHGLRAADTVQILICQTQLNQHKHTVFEACINRDGATAPDRVIQACTTLLDRKIISGRERYFLFANRADAYFSQGDKQHALDNYNEAIRLAPQSANLHYNRGIFYAAQSDDDAALRDFNIAIGIDAKLVPALHQRAKIYQARGNFSGALEDYSAAIRLQPNSAVLWSERGYVCVRQHDYANAIKDETRAIKLDPNLAAAYFLRGAAAAFGEVGDRAAAVSDIKNAVHLDPSLDRYVTTTGKNAYLALPPL